MHNIKKIYLYLVSLISLFIVVFGAITLLNMALKTWVFTKADNAYYYKPTLDSCTRPVYENETTVDSKVPPGYRPCTEAELKEMEQQQRDQQTGEKQRQASDAIAMILVGSPVFYFHWRLARKEQ